jgi:hypothetical protein
LTDYFEINDFSPSAIPKIMFTLEARLKSLSYVGGGLDVKPHGRRTNWL